MLKFFLDCLLLIRTMLLQKYKETVGLVKQLLGRRSPLVAASLLLFALGTAGSLALSQLPTGAVESNPVGDTGGEGAPANPSHPNPPPAPPADPLGWSLDAAFEVTNEDFVAPGSGTPVAEFAEAVAADDGSYVVTAKADVDGGWDGQVYKFKLDNPSANLSRITVSWIGYGEATDSYPVELEIYNQLLSQWQLTKQGQTTHVGQDIAVELDLVGSFSSYVGADGTLWARVTALNLELAAPTNLVATPAASNEVRLSWADSADSESGYSVERRTSAGNWSVIATLPAGSQVYTDYDPTWNTLVPGGKYYYRVSAVAGGSLSTSAESSMVTMPSKGTRSGNVISVPRDAATIQEALNLAQQNDTVQVAAGTYAEAVVIRTPKVKLAGAGVNATTISVPGTCAGEYCASVSISTNSSIPVTVQDLATSFGSGTLRNGVRYGGGVFLEGSAADLGRLKLFRATLPNSGAAGSAIALLNPDVVTVDNVAAMLNLADGPTVFVRGGTKGIVFKHVTLSGNGSGGYYPAAGLWVEGSSSSVDVVNSILWRNTTGEPEVSRDSQGTPVRVSYSVIGPITGSVPVATNQGPQLNGGVNADPLLTSYEDPHLLAGSPAIELGDPASGTSYDYENATRPQGAKPDAGASEYVEAKSGGGNKVSAPYAPRPLALPKTQPRPHASLNTDRIWLTLESATPPAAPSHLRIADVTEDRIAIRFLDNALDEDGFIVHRTQGGLEVALAPMAAHSGTGDVIFPDYGADLPSGRLAPGTIYCYYVSAYRGSARADSPEICQRTDGAAGTAPTAPSNLAAVGISAGQIRLTWTDNSDGEDGFVLYRKQQGSGADFSIVSPPAIANATSYVDSGGDTPAGILQSGTMYCYRVAAYNVHGLSLAVPATPDGVCVSTSRETWVEVFQGSGDASKQPSLVELGTPIGFEFEGENDAVELETHFADLIGGPSAYNWQVFAIHLDTPPEGLTSLTVRWRGRGEDQPDYPVRFSLYNFTTGSWVHQPVFPGGEVEGDVREGEGPIRNTSFTFILSTEELASDFSGVAADESNTVLLWVRARAYFAAPTAPANLREYPDAAPTTVYLAWDDLSSNEDGFEVQRAPIILGPVPLEPNWTTVRTTAPDVATYSESVPVASSYLYRVRAVRDGVGSAFTPELTVRTPLYPPYLPNVVPNGSDSIRVSWQMNPSNGARFPHASYSTEVYRAPGTTPFPQDWVLVATVADGVATYLDGGLQPDTTYSYRLRFSVPDGGATRYSTVSETVYTKTTASTAPPAPEDLTATPVSTSQINLAWKDVDGEVAYDLERQTGLTGTWQTVDGNIPADETSYGDVGLVAGQLYKYRLRAKSFGGFSNYSNEAQAATFPASGEQWQVVSPLPLRSGLVQGATVIASHGGYLYAASNDADNQGKPGWFHLNVWRSTDGGNRNPWEWVGQTTSDVDNNVPVAMASYSGKLYLLTGSRLWSGTGSAWAQVLGQGVGDAGSSGYFSHMTVYNGKLFVLVQDGTIFYTGDGASWFQSAAAPANVQALAQQGGFLLAAAGSAARGGAARLLDVYRSADGDTWLPLGGLVGEDGFGRCDAYAGVLGLGTRVFVGATDAAGQPCLWASSDGAHTWTRTGGAVNIWTALPDAAAAYVATTAQYPEPIAAKIDASTGNVELLSTTGLTNDYRIWSFASHASQRYAAAFPPAGVNPMVPEPAVILRLGS